ncbi:MAG TPA: glycosyltransferase [Candidatus Norongarragalinales archaeon]|jgi:cellulose synthase/poly-beta-1,6-N-acetylglucosamine synthase-like glycosyltransferase|nr:glycosyltransferase [Candidatus Norongarragalinales archaeon]
MTKASVGIAAYNEEKTIAQAVNCALRSVPRVHEVIVVASGCTDNTIGVVKGLQRKDARVKLVVESERRGKASAINKILKTAKGDFLVFTDADVYFAPDAIAKLLVPFKDKNVGGVTGRVQYYVTKPGTKMNSLKERLFDWWSKLASTAYDADRKRLQATGRMYEVTGYLYALRKGVVKEVPLFARSEDAFIGKRVIDAGLRVAYAPDAVVVVRYPDNFKDFLTQKARTRYGHLEVLEELHKERQEGVVREVEAPRAGGAGYFKIMGSLVKEPLHVLFAFVYPFMEALVWSLALLRFSFRVKEPWKSIRSTKTVYSS